MISVRTPLPNRRLAITETLEVAGHTFHATVGFDPRDGRPREVFLTGAKDGTQLAAILDDASVAVSIALQHGIPASTLVKSVARLPAAPLSPPYLDHEPRPGRAASVIGAALDLVRAFEKHGHVGPRDSRW